VSILSSEPVAWPGGSLGDCEGDLPGRTFDRQWLSSSFEAPPERLRLLDVSGDSMPPNVMLGVMVLADALPGQEHFKVGLWMVRIRVTLYIKRVQSLGKNKSVAASDNPAYSPIPLDKNTGMLARVIRFQHKFPPTDMSHPSLTQRGIGVQELTQNTRHISKNKGSAPHGTDPQFRGERCLLQNELKQG
jgi:hypothetical protein